MSEKRAKEGRMLQEGNNVYVLGWKRIRNGKGNELGHKRRREDKSKMSLIIGYCREKYEHSRSQIKG